MTNYIPRYAKKNDRFHALEASLVRLLRAGAADDDIERAADEVREQKIRALRARKAKFPPKESSAAELAALDEGIAAWQQVELSALLEIYRRHAAHDA
ncbi:MAG: hypothetical protein H6835_08890 [Planctomycetes bacterium]|nr:hypothetical protein [Planctomycetota bacterium]